MNPFEDGESEQSASILRGLLQNLPGMVYRGTADWTIDIMRGCEDLCGYTPAEVSALDGGWLALIHQEDMDRISREGAALREQPRSMVQEYRILTKAGAVRWVEDRKTSFFEDGQFAGVDGVLFDITERRQAEVELKKARDDLIAQQSRAIQELSTPVLQVWDEVLILPLVGTVDTLRAQQIIETLLQTIVKTQAAVTILDVTGVPVVDTAVANHLLKTIEAARMLGAEVIVTGISPENAQTLVKLGVDLSKVTARSSLQAGLRAGFELTNNEIVERSSQG